MFIGYEIKANQNQAKPITLETDIKLSQAVLDPSSKGNKNKEPVCLVAELNKKQFILAVLDPNQSWQSPLDLMFAAGTEVKFFVRGSGVVHVTGFESYDDLDDMSMSISSDEEIDEEEDESDAEPARKKIKEKVSAKKAPKSNGVAKTNGKKNGKVPHVAGDEAEEDDDDDDSDDDDFDVFADEEDDDDDDDDDDEVGQDGEDDDDDEEMLDDAEDDDSDE